MIEFRTSDNSPVEIDETYNEVWAKRSKRLITNGKLAIEVWQFRKRDRLLAAYEDQQRVQPPLTEAKVVTAPLRKTEEVKIEKVTAMKAAVAAPQVIDEEAEAQEFADAVADPVEVDPNDWFECKLKYRLPAPKQILIGELANGQAVYIHEREVTRCPAHSLCLPPGTSLFVRIEVNKMSDGKNHGRHQYRALECQIDGDPTELHQRGTVSNWQGSYGGGRMECGCNIFLRTDEQSDLNVGDRVEFDLTYSEKKRAWIGTNIAKAQDK